MQSGANLVKVIGTSGLPFEDIVFEDVVTISKVVWVTISLNVFRTICTVDVGISVEIDVISTVTWLKSHVVKSRSSILSEVSHWHSK